MVASQWCGDDLYVHTCHFFMNIFLCQAYISLHLFYFQFSLFLLDCACVKVSQSQCLFVALQDNNCYVKAKRTCVLMDMCCCYMYTPLLCLYISYIIAWTYNTIFGDLQQCMIANKFIVILVSAIFFKCTVFQN